MNKTLFFITTILMLCVYAFAGESNLWITKGDTETIVFTFTDSDSNDYDISSNTFTFTIGSTPKGTDILSKTDSDFTLSGNDAILELSTTDTDQTLGRYYWSGSFVDTNSKKYTFGTGSLVFVDNATAQLNNTEAVIGTRNITIDLAVAYGTQAGANILNDLNDVTISSPLDGQSLAYNAGSGVWENSTAGAGNVVGDSSSTDNALVRFDGATGKVIQNSGVLLDDSDNMILPDGSRLTVGNITMDSSGLSSDTVNLDLLADGGTVQLKSDGAVNYFSDIDNSTTTEDHVFYTDGNTTGTATELARITDGGDIEAQNSVKVGNTTFSDGSISMPGLSGNLNLSAGGGNLNLSSVGGVSIDTDSDNNDTVSDITFTTNGGALQLARLTDSGGLILTESFQVAGTSAINQILDEDNLASDSATALATQQSIKKYVDDNISAGGMTSFDLQGDTGTPETVTNGETVDIGGGTGITTTIGATNRITINTNDSEIDHDGLLNFDANEHFTQSNITTVGTIGTGTWQGSSIDSAYLDDTLSATSYTADTVTLSSGALSSLGALTIGTDTNNNETDSDIVFQTDNSSEIARLTDEGQLRVTDSVRVGLSPYTQMNAGDIFSQGSFSLSADADIYFDSDENNNGSGDFIFRTDAASTELMTLNDEGVLFVGNLRIGPGSLAGDIESDGPMVFVTDNDNDTNAADFIFFTNEDGGIGTELLRLTDEATVGISSSAPQNKLVVSDGVKSSDATTGTAIEIAANNNDASLYFNKDANDYVFGVDNTDGHFKLSNSNQLGTTDVFEYDGSFNISSNLEVTGQIYSGTESQSPTTKNITVDFNDGESFSIDLESVGADIDITLSNVVTGNSYILDLIQGSTERQISTITPGVVWQGGVTPSITATANATSIIGIWKSPSGTIFANSGDYY